MGKYLEYFKYLVDHKINYYNSSKSLGYFGRHSFTHDLSKFCPSEFFAYANKLYGPYNEFEFRFQRAFDLHRRRNKHHWAHWEGKCMPYRHILEMYCDWDAMGKVWGSTPREYYRQKRQEIKFDSHHDRTTIIRLLDEHEPERRILMVVDGYPQSTVDRYMAAHYNHNEDITFCRGGLSDLKVHDLRQYDHIVFFNWYDSIERYRKYKEYLKNEMGLPYGVIVLHYSMWGEIEFL